MQRSLSFSCADRLLDRRQRLSDGVSFGFDVVPTWKTVEDSLAQACEWRAIASFASTQTKTLKPKAAKSVSIGKLTRRNSTRNLLKSAISSLERKSSNAALLSRAESPEALARTSSKASNTAAGEAGLGLLRAPSSNSLRRTDSAASLPKSPILDGPTPKPLGRQGSFVTPLRDVLTRSDADEAQATLAARRYLAIQASPPQQQQLPGKGSQLQRQATMGGRRRSGVGSALNVLARQASGLININPGGTPEQPVVLSRRTSVARGLVADVAQIMRTQSQSSVEPSQSSLAPSASFVASSSSQQLLPPVTLLPSAASTAAASRRSSLAAPLTSGVNLSRPASGSILDRMRREEQSRAATTALLLEAQHTLALAAQQQLRLMEIAEQHQLQLQSAGNGAAAVMSRISEVDDDDVLKLVSARNDDDDGQSNGGSQQQSIAKKRSLPALLQRLQSQNTAANLTWGAALSPQPSFDFLPPTASAFNAPAHTASEAPTPQPPAPAAAAAPGTLLDQLQRRQRRRSSLLDSLESHYLPDTTAGAAATAAEVSDDDGAAGPTSSAGPRVRKMRLEEVYAQYAGPAINKYYSEKAILQRESMRFHPDVIAATRSMWSVYVSCLGKRMTRDGYLLIFGHAQRVVRNLIDGVDASSALAEDLSSKDGRDSALLRDWEVDSEGQETMDYAHFALSWFQVADLWTEDVSATSYAGLLDKLFHSMTRMLKVDDRPSGVSEKVLGKEKRELAFIYQHVPKYYDAQDIERLRRQREARLNAKRNIHKVVNVMKALIRPAARHVTVPHEAPPAAPADTTGDPASSPQPPVHAPKQQRPVPMGIRSRQLEPSEFSDVPTSALPSSSLDAYLAADAVSTSSDESDDDYADVAPPHPRMPRRPSNYGPGHLGTLRGQGDDGGEAQYVGESFVIAANSSASSAGDGLGAVEAKVRKIRKQQRRRSISAASKKRSRRYHARWLSFRGLEMAVPPAPKVVSPSLQEQAAASESMTNSAIVPGGSQQSEQQQGPASQPSAVSSSASADDAASLLSGFMDFLRPTDVKGAMEQQQQQQQQQLLRKRMSSLKLVGDAAAGSRPMLLSADGSRRTSTADAARVSSRARTATTAESQGSRDALLQSRLSNRPLHNSTARSSRDTNRADSGLTDTGVIDVDRSELASRSGLTAATPHLDVDNSAAASDVRYDTPGTQANLLGDLAGGSDQFESDGDGTRPIAGSVSSSSNLRPLVPALYRSSTGKRPGTRARFADAPPLVSSFVAADDSGSGGALDASPVEAAADAVLKHPALLLQRTPSQSQLRPISEDPRAGSSMLSLLSAQPLLLRIGTSTSGGHRSSAKLLVNGTTTSRLSRVGTSGSLPAVAPVQSMQWAKDGGCRLTTAAADPAVGSSRACTTNSLAFARITAEPRARRIRSHHRQTPFEQTVDGQQSSTTAWHSFLESRPLASSANAATLRASTASTSLTTTARMRSPLPRQTRTHATGSRQGSRQGSLSRSRSRGRSTHRGGSPFGSERREDSAFRRDQSRSNGAERSGVDLRDGFLIPTSRNITAKEMKRARRMPLYDLPKGYSVSRMGYGCLQSHVLNKQNAAWKLDEASADGDAGSGSAGVRPAMLATAASSSFYGRRPSSTFTSFPSSSSLFPVSSFGDVHVHPRANEVRDDDSTRVRSSTRHIQARNKSLRQLFTADSHDADTIRSADPEATTGSRARSHGMRRLGTASTARLSALGALTGRPACPVELMADPHTQGVLSQLAAMRGHGPMARSSSKLLADLLLGDAFVAGNVTVFNGDELESLVLEGEKVAFFNEITRQTWLPASADQR